MTLALALDTATEYLAVGLADVDRSTGESCMLGSVALLAPRAANSRALPLAAGLLSECGRQATDIGVVVAGRGPGSFTGVRIGLATAKGIAHGLGVGLVAVPTPDAVAFPALEAARAQDGAATVAVVGDAMRGQVYLATYRWASDVGPQRLDPFTAESPQIAASRLFERSGSFVLVGNGLAKYRAVFASALGERASFLEEPLWAPAANGLFEAARRCLPEALAEPTAYDPGAVLPIYTRLSDAEEAEAAREGGRADTVPSVGVAGPGGAQERPGRDQAGWPMAGDAV